MLNPVRVLLMSLLLLAVGDPVDASDQDPVDLSDHPWIGEAAPGFTLDTVAGEKLSLEDLRGKYVVVHFGASW